MMKAMISGRCPTKPPRREAERADHHLHADELQRDIGHGGDDAGQRDGEREQAAAEAVAHIVGRGDMAALVRDRPEPREDEIEDRIDQDRVGDGEEAHGALAEHERRHGDEGVGGVEVAAEQEPGDDGAEAAPAEPPFMQQIEIGLAPMRGDEAEPGDEQEQGDEDDRRGQIEGQRMSPGNARCVVFDWAFRRMRDPPSRWHRPGARWRRRAGSRRADTNRRRECRRAWARAGCRTAPRASRTRESGTGGAANSAAASSRFCLSPAIARAPLPESEAHGRR